MIIERVHGLQATGISLNDRFTILAATAPTLRVPRPRPRRASNGGFININNQNVIDRLVNQIGQQNKRKAIRQRLGMPGLRRFGSESSLPGLRRSNSLSNLSQRSVKNQQSWRQSNNNLNRSASFSSLAQGIWRGRGFRRRGGRMGLMRGRMRGRGGRQQLVWRVRGGARGRGGAARGTAGMGRGGRGVAGMARGGRGGGRGAARGRGSVTTAGAASRQTKPVPSKEELDLQLDQYMASTKSALDKELEAYMNNAMDLE